MKKKQEAFTLLELLISTTILVVVMAAIYASFRTGIFGFRDIEENIDTYQAARQIIEQLNRDLRSACVYRSDDAKFNGQVNRIGFLTLVDRYSNNQMLQDYAFVAYYLDGQKLMRLCRRNQDSLNDNSVTKPEEILSSIEQISFSYGYFNTPHNPTDPLLWKESWGDQPIEKTKLPLCVNVKLKIIGKQSYSFERTIYLPLAEN